MRRARHILPLLPALLAMSLWARSYCRFDIGVGRRWMLNSESGSLYFFNGAFVDTPSYISGPARTGGRFEAQTGGTYRPWLPIRTWNYQGDRIWAVGWWTITAVCAAPAWWTWRQRQRIGTRGFEVQEAAGKPVAPPSAPTDFEDGRVVGFPIS